MQLKEDHKKDRNVYASMYDARFFKKINFTKKNIYMNCFIKFKFTKYKY